jgi:chorismate-pyruvate lyase
MTLTQSNLTSFLQNVQCFMPTLQVTIINKKILDTKCDNLENQLIYLNEGSDILSRYVIGLYNSITETQFLLIYDNMRKIYIKNKK